MAYLQCPQCRLTVRAIAYYLRGDECPRCLTIMLPCEGVRGARAAGPPPRVRDDPALAPGPIALPAVLE